MSHGRELYHMNHDASQLPTEWTLATVCFIRLSVHLYVPGVLCSIQYNFYTQLIGCDAAAFI